MHQKTIVISAVNLVEAGTLAILRECLSYLSTLNASKTYRIVALVYDRNLVPFENIEFIETKWPKKRWINRLWYEYVTMKKISKELSPVYLWFSLHDTSPSVVAERRAVYCHNSYSFYKWKMHDLIFAPKIALFAIFTKYIYKTNIHKNKYLVVQQGWFREAMSKMFHIEKERIIVAKPNREMIENASDQSQTKEEPKKMSFLFAGSPNSHKNFEVICQAAELLEKKGITDFEAHITVRGNENKYAKWLYDKWGSLRSVNFIGFQSKDSLLNLYKESYCLIFPSKVESWGLPISEFAVYKKPMILADLPYAHETSAGADYVAYFNPESAESLSFLMEELIRGDLSSFKKQEEMLYLDPQAHDWSELFQILLTE